MTSSEVTSAYIKKLTHPLKEIRERSLQLLIAKIRLGWEFEDELSGTRELLEALITWFQPKKPSLQKEALELLLTTIKTKAGTYIAKELGIQKLLLNLNVIKKKIDPTAMEMFEDVLDTLRFLKTVDSEVNCIPRLRLHSENSSESNGLGSAIYNIGLTKESSKETSESNEDIQICTNNNKVSDCDGVNMLLFPWVDLNPSDLKTMLLIEDSLKVLKSTRRCCRFIRNVFLRDFPPEIFLNRPVIVKTLLGISDGQISGNPGEALKVLLCITDSLHMRFLKLFSLDLVSKPHKLPDDHRDSDDNINMELATFADGNCHVQQNEALVALRQLPAPLFALETSHTVLTIMARSLLYLDTEDQEEVLDMKDLNTCLSLIESLIKLLLDCVNEQFWSMDHTSKTHRDIAHKASVVMRMLGDLLTKYRKSFHEDTNYMHHRSAYLRLVPCGEMLLSWAKRCALPPSSLVKALQVAQIDPAIQLLYGGLSERIDSVLISTKSSVDQEYNSKYRELSKLFFSMDNAVKFIKMKESSRLSKDILSCLKNALPVLHLNLNEHFLNETAVILLRKTKDMDLHDADWDVVRNITLTLMAHSLPWVQVYFYKMLADMVKSVLLGDNDHQSENEKCLTLICDVGILTEICCHGLSSSDKEIENYASEVLLYLLRGRLVLSDSCWWRLLASLLPVLPLLHVYAAHETELGKAICKSLERDIVQCMGVGAPERAAGLARLLLGRCAAVQLDAAHELCAMMDDSKYLPPKESLRADILLNALRRIEPQDFNIDQSSSPSKTTQTSSLLQILEVLKQDLTLDTEYIPYVYSGQPALEPSLRRSTLQQLALIMRHQGLHEMFLQYDGVKLIVCILRLSLMVDDYLAFPECAVSCVCVLNSVAYASRHALAAVRDLPLLLLRVILVFPANDNSVLMAAQVLALVAWAGFALQELNSSRHRVPALPANVTERTNLPFIVNSYWKTSPNPEHSFVEWLMGDETFRTAIRVRWWWVWGGSELLKTSYALSPLTPQPSSPAPPPHPRELAALTSASLQHVFSKLLLHLENATSHDQVNEVLVLLQSYTSLVPVWSASACVSPAPWRACARFLSSVPASPRDVTLLDALLHLVIAYMDYFPRKDGTVTWILTSFIGTDAAIIALLSRDSLYPQQTSQEDIEVTQLRIHIIKVLVRCVILLEDYKDYSSSRLESLLKILLSCLERIDLKNFHMLGYLNELIRCVRYVMHSRYCKLSEETIIISLKVITSVLNGCASGAGRKGQAGTLDSLLALLALLKQIHENSIPVQRWSEFWSSSVVAAVVKCSAAERVEVRASALHVLASLSHHAQLTSQLLQCIPNESMSQLAIDIFRREGEANVVRAAAACLLTAITSRTSPHSQVLEREVLQAMVEGDFIEECLHIFVEFCNAKEYEPYVEPNIPLSVLDRGSELEVRAQKSEFQLSPTLAYTAPPPTASLVAAAADVINNVTLYKTAPVQVWNEKGLYRILFRCISHTTCSAAAGACRALCASCSHKCVRVALADTKDCVYHLLLTLTPVESVNDLECLFARSQAMLLLASLLSERPTFDAVCELKDKSILLNSLLQGLESNHNELREAAMHCLTQLASSIVQAKNNKGKEQKHIKFFEELKSPYQDGGHRHNAGDVDDCQPELMVEEICKVLINLFRRHMDDKKYLSGQDPTWSLAASCLSTVLSASAAARSYCAHRRLARDLTRALQGLRDQLTLMGKPVDVIRNANHEPTLSTLNWILTLTTSLMLDYTPAKERIADDIASSLTRLWPWTMMTEVLRDSVMGMLLIFTNDCPRAWSSMCACVGSRSLLWEVCSLAVREAARPRPARALRTALRVMTHCAAHHHCRAVILKVMCVGSRSLVWEVCSLAVREAARPRPARALRTALRVMTHCAAHHHCRAVILKSDVLSCACKLRGRCAWSSAAWCSLCRALCLHAEGAGAVLSALSAPALRPAPAALLPALAHAAHHCRLTFLQSPDLLELLSSCLLTGDTTEIVSASRAVWALAANNHRAKLVLRSAGIQTAVQTTLQRLQNSQDVPTQRALELLTYTNTVLQAT